MSASRSPSGVDTVVDDLELRQLVEGRHHDPHHYLGAHVERDADDRERVVIRGWRPDAVRMAALIGGERLPMTRIHPAGLFAVVLTLGEVPRYRLEAEYRDGTVTVFDDPYALWPTLGELDLHLISEGRHEGLWRHLGAHVRVHQGLSGTSFAVWAPSARGVRVVGDFNGWDGRLHPMRVLGSSGVWEIFLPGVQAGARYKYEVFTQQGYLTLRADPFAFQAELPPATASIVNESTYAWGDQDWIASRATANPFHEAFSIYECHLGSWRQTQDENGSWRPLTYREAAEQLPDYLVDLGFTHVEFLPLAQHPFSGSWGYQVTGYYAPTSQYGSPDDFRYLVDRLHQAGIGVLVDWVAAHFPKDDWALARFDGTNLYEHQDPRQAEHPDWGTLVFNYGRHEVRNFLLANALYWIEEFHLDGLRVDAVASMLYLDYSRRAGQWVPNRFGGRENLEAIDFIKEVNEVVYRHHPAVMMVAEESTSWPAVSRPTYLGGLGFGFKWNMGWMNDTLVYFTKEPIHRRYHHNELTFALLYAFHENFILPLSHDEVAHGKGSLLSKMPGDRWQQFANLRALLGWMWAHPGRPLLFMGGEIGQNDEWRFGGSVDWHLAQYPEHGGIQSLVRRLNHVYRDHPALWQRDFDWTGFRWIDANDVDNSVLSFLRIPDGTGPSHAGPAPAPHGAGAQDTGPHDTGPDDTGFGDGTPGDRMPGDSMAGDVLAGRRAGPVACVANLTPVVREDYRIGLSRHGRWVEILNTDSAEFGGSGVTVGEVQTEPIPWNDLECSVSLRLPPLGVVWLAWEDASGDPDGGATPSA